MNEQQIKFLQTVTPPALAQQRVFGIPAAVTIAQAILESATKEGWGTSSLFLEANNPFGIQYFHPVNKNEPAPVQRQSWEVEDGKPVPKTELFRNFRNLMDAFTAHALLLMGPRYRPCYAERGNWQTFAERLGPKTSATDTEHCGYSTNPGYSATLIELVKEFHLDDPRVLLRFAAGHEPEPQYQIQNEGVSK